MCRLNKIKLNLTPSKIKEVETMEADPDKSLEISPFDKKSDKPRQKADDRMLKRPNLQLDLTSSQLSNSVVDNAQTYDRREASYLRPTVSSSNRCSVIQRTASKERLELKTFSFVNKCASNMNSLKAKNIPNVKKDKEDSLVLKTHRVSKHPKPQVSKLGM